MSLVEVLVAGAILVFTLLGVFELYRQAVRSQQIARAKTGIDEIEDDVKMEVIKTMRDYVIAASAHPETPCHTDSSPFTPVWENFLIPSGILIEPLSPSSLPQYSNDVSGIAHALAKDRCLVRQTLVGAPVDFSNERGYYFCLRLSQMPGSLETKPILSMQPLFAEFHFSLWNGYKESTVTCRRADNLSLVYGSMLHYTFYWTQKDAQGKDMNLRRSGYFFLAETG